MCFANLDFFEYPVATASQTSLMNPTNHGKVRKPSRSGHLNVNKINKGNNSYTTKAIVLNASFITTFHLSLQEGDN